MTISKPADFLPLREPTFYILLSLIPEDRHGYAIMKEVEALSKGKVRLSTGTLYEALSRLLEQGLLERLEELAVGEMQPEARSPQVELAGPGKPRKIYRLTRLGLRVIEAETARLISQADTARRQLGERWAGNTPFD